MNRAVAALGASLALLALMPSSMASSHREAPFIAGQPKLDATDLYMFRSYEAGRRDFVTLLANYMPFQDAQSGPNFHMFSPEALYEIHIDNNGDAAEDITFQFRFSNTSKATALMVGGKQVKMPQRRRHRGRGDLGALDHQGQLRGPGRRFVRADAAHLMFEPQAAARAKARRGWPPAHPLAGRAAHAAAPADHLEFAP